MIYTTLRGAALALACNFLLVHSAQAQGRVYVDGSLTTGLNNGTSWANAYKDLQAALDNPVLGAQNWCEFWIKGGTYKAGTLRTSRFTVFELGNESAEFRLYGGFEGVETLLRQRPASAAPTILSGDVDNDNANNDTGDAYRILDLRQPTLLDRVRVEHAFANGSSNNPNSGGAIGHISGDLTIQDSSFRDCHAADLGGAIYSNLRPYDIRIRQTVFTSCTAISRVSTLIGGGGAIAFHPQFQVPLEGQLALDGVTFKACQATRGGAIYLRPWGNPLINGITVTNCLFNGNAASLGGGVYVGASMNGAWNWVLISHSTFVNNVVTNNIGQPSYGACVYNELANQNVSGRVEVTSCIMWDNQSWNIPQPGQGSALIPSQSPSVGGQTSQINSSYLRVTYSDASDALPISGVGNISMNPLFVNPGAEDFRLSANSPCIDAGRDEPLVAVSQSYAIITGGDRADQDRDNNVMELIRFDRLNGLRERATLPPGSVLGFEWPGSVANAVSDMGCYEF